MTRHLDEGLGEGAKRGRVDLALVGMQKVRDQAKRRKNDLANGTRIRRQQQEVALHDR
ncbi:MAG: hypothetical protein IT371_07470 [Deltaproteobacteria bacterium]|nr:hypothetical protein [Deltaproteobacteria bacterium]